MAAADATTNTFRGSQGTNEISFCQAGPCRSIYLYFFPNRIKQTSVSNYAKKDSKRRRHTRRRSPLSFFPFSFKYDTMSGHTPMMVLTTFNSPGRKRSPVSIALWKDSRDRNQSRCYDPFRRITMKSVRENGSRVPKTRDANFWRHRFRSRKSKVG